jgi:hypothetical protein
VEGRRILGRKRLNRLDNPATLLATCFFHCRKTHGFGGGHFGNGDGVYGESFSACERTPRVLWRRRWWLGSALGARFNNFRRITYRALAAQINKLSTILAIDGVWTTSD